jgi:hypothetical protein
MSLEASTVLYSLYDAGDLPLDDRDGIYIPVSEEDIMSGKISTLGLAAQALNIPIEEARQDAARAIDLIERKPGLSLPFFGPDEGVYYLRLPRAVFNDSRR